jgi:hypothetical protein
VACEELRSTRKTPRAPLASEFGFGAVLTEVDPTPVLGDVDRGVEAGQGAPEQNDPSAIDEWALRTSNRNPAIPPFALSLWLRNILPRPGGSVKMRILGIVALGAALGGCASSSADITPACVSPVMYQGIGVPLERPHLRLSRSDFSCGSSVWGKLLHAFSIS